MITSLFGGILVVLKDSFLALIPLVLIFIGMQLTILKLSKEQFFKLLSGLLITFIGLVLFLHGVNISFIKLGNDLGYELGNLEHLWLIVPIGFVLGFIVTMAEPAVKILNMEIEKMTSGFINQKILLYFLSLGVGSSIALTMLRILTNISLWYFILPGYVLILILTRYVDPLFVAIAFDAGGVVTGLMIATFLLAITVSCAHKIHGGNVFIEGFGMIALVALVPILFILVLGLLYERKIKEGGKRNEQ